MSFNKYLEKRKTAQKPPAEDTRESGRLKGSSLNEDVMLELFSAFQTIDEKDVFVLNMPATAGARWATSDVSDEETNQHFTEIQSEELAILSDSSNDLESPTRFVMSDRADFCSTSQSNNERIDDWCLSHLSEPKPTLLDPPNASVRDKAKSWGIDSEAPTCIGLTLDSHIIKEGRPLGMSAYESNLLAKLSAGEIGWLAKFIKGLVPYLLQERAARRPPHPKRRYKDIPTLFPESKLLVGGSLGIGNISPVLNICQQVRQLLFNTLEESTNESIDDIPLTPVSSLYSESWYGWHLVPRIRESDF
ncbi:HDL406Cp [Eremothecium sinecaudum]|uniref:HDL406Cp n=1 Tax=Eremothecium sinecaudum TaxID=45286 RepID=A0A109UYP7_9SACH|nr:HDL406Cp [Eremothecium sinecaudum]AMD20338.1 HDL406Cp [Eremothecium sinecaudum]